ncbi:NifB/NifX family molybdenum-iron cluster-binding protein [Celerinatantimonas yamalensis]|uniref:NifB/NifX family molybdenum-iron cluster-binding protein n=1 Tax=Celerinatantimonas yamalensis TaxID=559956 RepID=A0ABW9G3N0_9GAMM
MENVKVRRQLQLANGEISHLKVAFASSDQHQVNQHFASASRFSIYSVGQGAPQLVEIIEMSEPPSGHHQDNIEMRLNLLKDCLAVYVVAVGDAVVRLLWAKGIRPVRVLEGSSILALVTELHRELNRKDAPLKRQIHHHTDALSDWDDGFDEQWDDSIE